MKKISRLLLLIIPIFFQLELSSQTYSSIISDKNINDFIENEIKMKSSYPKRFYHLSKRIYCKPIHWGNADWDMSYICSDTIKFEYKFLSIKDSLRKYFNEIDLGYFKEQYYKQIISNWTMKSKYVRFLKKPKIDYYEFTIPFFTKDLKTAIFYEYYYCGPVCAYSAIWIYNWDGNKWIRSKYLDGWIS